MRKIEYLSPSSIAKFEESRESFYLNYLADRRPPRIPQNHHMAIGSAFDAYAKSYMHEQLFGKDNDSRFNLVKLFETQVEPQNRDKAWEDGKEAFKAYQRSGALADLMIELKNSIGTPRFELDVKGQVNGYREGTQKTIDNHQESEPTVAEKMALVLLGKPDVFYVNKMGCHVILDFKVNGWYGRGNTSPKPGYIRIRSGSGEPILTGPHDDCQMMMHNGMMINIAGYLEHIDEAWARQLAIYGWLCGAEVGSDFITAIDQLCGKNVGERFPKVRIAEHRLRISSNFQWKVLERAREIWELCHSNHYFRDLSVEDSRGRCEMLEAQAKQLYGPETEEDAIFNTMTRE